MMQNTQEATANPERREERISHGRSLGLSTCITLAPCAREWIEPGEAEATVSGASNEVLRVSRAATLAVAWSGMHIILWTERRVHWDANDL